MLGLEPACSFFFFPHIELEFRSQGANIPSHELAQNLDLLIRVMEDKLQLIQYDTKHKKIIKFLDRENGFFGKIIQLNHYLNSWSGDNMTFKEYLTRRAHHTSLIEEMRNRLRDFETNVAIQNKEGQRRITEILIQIEIDEIRGIYGSDTVIELSF
jgi:hypothetical protein